MGKDIKQVKKNISEIFLKDQDIRQNPNSTLEEIRAYEDDFTQYLKKVVSDFGWITISKFGKNVSYQAGILVTHTQEKDFAERCLKLMEENIDDIDKANFALVYDKVMISAGKSQRYGTKLKSYFNKAGTVVTEVMPLEDPENIDVLRTGVGLGPLSDYIKRSETLFLKVTGTK